MRDDPALRFCCLADFDSEMTHRLAKGDALDGEPTCLAANEPDKVLAFVRGRFLFAFNFNPTRSFEGYGIVVPPATRWRHAFDTDETRFGGQGRISAGGAYEPELVRARGEIVQQIRLYLPARTAIVLARCARRSVQCDLQGHGNGRGDR